MKEKVKKYYSSVSDIYDEMYDEKKLLSSEIYMADYFRYKLIIKRIKKLKITGKILDVGCGEGTPLIRICKSTKLEPLAFDITENMVEKTKHNFIKNKFDPKNVLVADISKKNSYKNIFSNKKFDVALCLGVMPHVEDITLTLNNIRKKLKKNGRLFVSFRNELFSLFTLNRPSKEFFLDKLFTGINSKQKKLLEKDLDSRFAVKLPPLRMKNKKGGPGYDTTPSRFHNPLTIDKATKDAGFKKQLIHFYHYHPLPPMYENKHVSKKLFRELSIELEKNPNDWRGYFMCSAFLLELTA